MSSQWKQSPVGRDKSCPVPAARSWGPQVSAGDIPAALVPAAPTRKASVPFS